jgi:hypothetical protein
MSRTTSKSGKVGRVLVVAVASLLMVTALMAAGKGGGGKVTASGSEKCYVSPDPTLNGQQAFTVNGSGFKNGQVVDIRIGGGGGMFASADDFGNFAASAWAAFSQTGSMEVKIYQMGDRRMTVLAKCTFEVR